MVAESLLPAKQGKIGEMMGNLPANHPLHRAFIIPLALLLSGLLACTLLTPPDVDLAAPATETAGPSASPTGSAAPPVAFTWPPLPAAAAAGRPEGALTPDASPPFLGDGVAYATEIGSQEVLFLFDPLPGASYLILLLPEPTLDPLLIIRDERGSELDRIDKRTTGEAELIRFTAEDDRRRVFAVAGFEGSRGQAKIAVAREGGPFIQSLVEVEEAVAEDEYNRYDLSLTAGRAVLFQVEPVEEFDPVFELYGPAGFLFNRDQGSTAEGEEYFWVPEASGRYALTVFGFEFSPGSYRLQVLEMATPN